MNAVVMVKWMYEGKDFWRESTGASGVEELGALCTWRGQIERFGV